MADQALWYVAHTFSGHENKVAQDLRTMVENRHLQDLICDVRVPVEITTEDVLDKNGNKIGEKEVQSKLYPSYVFVKMVMNDETWYIVRNTRGCTGFVGPGSKPEPLSEAEVENGRGSAHRNQGRLCCGRQCRDRGRPAGRLCGPCEGDRHQNPQGEGGSFHVWPRYFCRTGPGTGQNSLMAAAVKETGIYFR